MIKFILAVIAMIFVGLAAYVYMNPKETDAPVARVAQKTERSIVKKEALSVEKESISAKVEVISKGKVDDKELSYIADDMERHLTSDTHLNYHPNERTTSNSRLSLDDHRKIMEALNVDTEIKQVSLDTKELNLTVPQYKPMENRTSDEMLSSKDQKAIIENLGLHTPTTSSISSEELEQIKEQLKQKIQGK